MNILQTYKDQLEQIKADKEECETKSVLIRRLPEQLHKKVRILSINSGYSMEDIIILSIEFLFDSVIQDEARKILNK